MNRIRIFRKGSLFVWLLGVVLFGGALSWFLCSGPQNDDFVYLHEFVGDEPFSVTFNYSEGGAITTLPQLFSSIGKHYLYWTNGRLGSALIFAANLWPFWLTAAMSAGALVAMFMLVMRLGLGHGWSRRPLSCMLITLMLWWLLPWHEFMLAQAYAINYVWAGALYLWFLLLLLTGRGRLWCVCLLGFVASTMHEGLSMTLDVVLLCMCVRELVRHGWQNRLMLPSIVFALGSLTVLLSPSVGLRSTGMITYFQMYWRGLVQLLMLMDWIFPFTCLIALVAYRRLPRRVFRRWWGLAWPVLVAAVVTLGGKFLVGGIQLRALWLSDILLLIVCAVIGCRGARDGNVWRHSCCLQSTEYG